MEFKNEADKAIDIIEDQKEKNSLYNKDKDKMIDQKELIPKIIAKIRLKRKKTFGEKMKLSEWKNLRSDFNNENDILTYLNQRVNTKIDRDELIAKFNINPTESEKSLLKKKR